MRKKLESKGERSWEDGKFIFSDFQPSSETGSNRNEGRIKIKYPYPIICLVNCLTDFKKQGQCQNENWYFLSSVSTEIRNQISKCQWLYLDVLEIQKRVKMLVTSSNRNNRDMNRLHTIERFSMSIIRWPMTLNL